MYWFSKDDEFARTCLDAVSPDADVATNLKQIRDALTIDMDGDGGIDFDNLSSIPDIWATHRIFDMMLYLPANVRSEDPVLEKYHEAVIRQWRAILTVMLIGQSEYGLQIVSQDFSAGLIMGQAASGVLSDRFMGAVVSARPRSFIWANENDVPFNQDRIRVYSIQVRGELLPIAVSSPTTYYVPTPDAWKNLYGRVPWIKKTMDTHGRTRYKVREDFLSELGYTEAVAMEQALRTGLRTPVTPVDISRANTYSGLLNGFLYDPNLVQARNYFNRRALFIPELSYFSGAISMVAPDDTDPLLGGVDPCCYYIDRKSFMNNGKELHHYFQFFMPITKLCRSLIAEGILDYSITVTTNAENLDDATVVLTKRSDGAKLQMSFGGANPIHKIERTSDISSVTLWPRQKIEGWTTYYAFRYDEEIETSQVTGKVYAHYTIEPDATCSCLPVESRGQGEEYRYYAMNSFPEYWTVEKEEGNQAAHVGYIKTRISGVVPEAYSGNTYYAAIDFGTTSTMLYGCINDGVPQPISAGALYAGAVCNPDRLEKDRNTGCFVPPKSGVWNIALLHSLLAVAPHATESTPSMPLYGTWAFFRAAASEKRALPDIEGLQIHSNLKWSVVNPFDTKDYLKEILYFLALDARVNLCKRLSVYASYPAAMSDPRKKTFLKVVSDIQNDIASATGVVVAPVCSVTESFAVATEVKGDGLGTNFCSIDIGGGTSDIFLYYKTDLHRPWQGIGSSLKIGAREIFHSEFFRNPELLKIIFQQKSGEPAVMMLIDQFQMLNPRGKGKLNIRELMSVKLPEQETQSAIEGLLDFTILKSGGHYPAEQILKDVVQTSNDVQILNFRQRIALYLGAVCYYAGMLARERKGMEPIQISNLTIRFAGNGSKIIDWISNRDGAISTFVKEMFSAGMQKTQLPRAVEFSSMPKHEVARGALLSRGNGLQVQEQNIILAGERYIEGRAVRSEFSPMDAIVPNDSINPEQDEIKAFLAAFNRSIASVVPCRDGCRRYEFPEKDEFGFRDKVLEIMTTLRNNNEELKPFFLIGVEVIDNLSRQNGGAAKQ